LFKIAFYRIFNSREENSKNQVETFFILYDLCFIFHLGKMKTDLINYKRIEKAIKFLHENVKNQPSLEETAEQVHMSPFHFQKTFTEWAGVSPKKFVQYLTIEELKKELESTRTIAHAADHAGLSAQSRVYDLFVNIESVTPQEYKNKGAGIEIEYGTGATPFGSCFIASTQRGICYMSFNENDDLSLEELKMQWPNAALNKNEKSISLLAESIFKLNKNQTKLNLFLKGTKFQLKVWEALLKIPFGKVSSYSLLAHYVKQANAQRAVGSAVAANPIAFLIPCHRVIRNEGIIGNYHWGVERKAAMLGWEKSKRYDTTKG
jgi:AraC family transcriptional regulator, regulatory protein of adaptative response / methylated-DNA-[protein]-cysteine methyltransferase